MKKIELLFNLAREKAGNSARLAEALGIPQSNLRNMETGKRAVSPETTVDLCNYLGLSGEEAREWLAIAVIENPKNSSRAEMLRRALFACWVLGVGALPTLLQTDARASGMASTVATKPQLGLHLSDLPNIHCRASLWLRRWLRKVLDRGAHALNARFARPLIC